MDSLKCHNCSGELKYDFETKEIKCNFCGTISDFENDKTDKTLNPQKILLFEIGLDDVKERINKFFENSAFEYKNYIQNELQPIYIPYWMYDCNCEVEYEYYIREHNLTTTRRGRNQLYLKKANVECMGVLEKASSEIENNLTDKLEKYFDLSKLRMFDDTYVKGLEIKGYDTTLKMAYGNLNEKLKREAIEKELGFPSMSVYKKIDVSEEQATYIQLPFYYAEIKGLKILVNGQTGDISINSKEYLKTERRLAFDRFLYSDAIQNNSGAIGLLGAILIIALICGISVLKDKATSIFPSLGIIMSVVFLIGFFGFLSWYKANNSMKKQRYIKNIRSYYKKRLSLLDEYERAKNKPNKTKVNIVRPIFGLAGGIGLLLMLAWGVETLAPIIYPHMISNDGNIFFIALLVVALLFVVIKTLLLIVRCILLLKEKI